MAARCPRAWSALCAWAVVAHRCSLERGNYLCTLYGLGRLCAGFRYEAIQTCLDIRVIEPGAAALAVEGDGLVALREKLYLASCFYSLSPVWGSLPHFAAISLLCSTPIHVRKVCESHSVGGTHLSLVVSSLPCSCHNLPRAYRNRPCYWLEARQVDRPCFFLSLWQG